MTRFILAALLCLAFASPSLAAADGKETTWERVMRTKTLRCGYTVYPTLVEKDPNTGTMSGPIYDITNEMGKLLGVKIEWVTEVGTDMIFEGFHSGRYDTVCAGYFNVPARTMGGDFTRPLYFIPFYTFVRAKEDRFKTIDDLNKVGVTVATMDGEFSSIAAKQYFPNAKEFSVQGLTTAAERMELVAAGKADFTPFEAGIGIEYMNKNPGKIKRFGDKPIFVGASTIIIPHNEFALKQMLDTAIENMIYSGTIEQILKKNKAPEGSVLLPALPYQLPSGK